MRCSGFAPDSRLASIGRRSAGRFLEIPAASAIEQAPIVDEVVSLPLHALFIESSARIVIGAKDRKVFLGQRH